MVIRVIYLENSSGTVQDYQLDDLITSRKIVAFCRSNGWVTIGRDPVRGMGGHYVGPKRRTNELDTPTDFFG